MKALSDLLATFENVETFLISEFSVEKLDPNVRTSVPIKVYGEDVSNGLMVSFA